MGTYLPYSFVQYVVYDDRDKNWCPLLLIVVDLEGKSRLREGSTEVNQAGFS